VSSHHPVPSNFTLQQERTAPALLAVEANKFKGCARPQRLAASNGVEARAWQERSMAA